MKYNPILLLKNGNNTFRHCVAQNNNGVTIIPFGYVCLIFCLLREVQKLNGYSKLRFYAFNSWKRIPDDNATVKNLDGK